jgi:transcriptional regulator with PAS, ATPase and Fis domain
VLLASHSLITAADLSLRQPKTIQGRIDEMSLEEVEAFLIRKALVRYASNVSQAADALGLSRSALYRRMQRYGI